MTVDEMIEKLQEISAQGKGNYTITFDDGSCTVRSTYIIDELECVDMFPYD